MVSDYEKYLKETEKTEKPEAPPSIKWIKSKSVVVEASSNFNLEENEFEMVTLRASNSNGDKEILDTEVMLWTTPNTLKRAFMGDAPRKGDVLGIKYHGTEPTSDGYNVKVFSVSKLEGS